jgi:hypothetical protein
VRPRINAQRRLDRDRLGRPDQMKFDDHVRAARKPPRPACGGDDGTASWSPTDEMTVGILSPCRAHTLEAWLSVLAIALSRGARTIQVNDGMMNSSGSRLELHGADESIRRKRQPDHEIPEDVVVARVEAIWPCGLHDEVGLADRPRSGRFGRIRIR